MGLTHSSVVAAPLADVFAWHERSGAIARLTPPWSPVRVAAEAPTLRNGRAVLQLPGGISWGARHSGYDPPHRFVDELISLPLRWRHTHEFAAEPGGGTRVTDRVDTPVPALLLRQMFRFRHRQLADDLAVHQLIAGYRSEPLTVAMTGSSGLVGSALTALLTTGGHRVIRLVRHRARTSDERTWQPDDPDPQLLDGADAVVHLAGASIAGRFTEAHKRMVRDSRVGPIRRLAELVARTPGGPQTLVAASAVGYYGSNRGEEVLNESSRRGEGFLADVVADWEAATTPAADAGIRVVNMRTGIVQSPRGGTLQLFRPLFTAGLGGRLGSGRQWTPWIDLDDLTDLYYRGIVDPLLRGPINATAPNPVRNSDYTATLARVLHRPALLPVPPLGPRLLLGTEGSTELAEANQRVQPDVLRSAQHRFRHPVLEGCLRHQLGRC